MCGHCRTIVAGAFVVGGIIGFLTSNLLLNKKYKAAYEEEAERTREAGKRIIKGLKERLEKSEEVYSGTDFDGDIEEYRQHAEMYISSDKAEELAEALEKASDDGDLKLESSLTAQFSEAETEKIPEGKSEEANPEFIPKDIFDCTWPEPYHKGHFWYIKDSNIWMQIDGAKRLPMKEAEAVDILEATMVRELYKKAGAMRKPQKTFYIHYPTDRFICQVDLWQSEPVDSTE